MRGAGKEKGREISHVQIKSDFVTIALLWILPKRH